MNWFSLVMVDFTYILQGYLTGTGTVISYDHMIAPVQVK